MCNSVKSLTEIKKDFINLFKDITRHENVWKVWRDFCFFSSTALKNCVPGQYSEELENEYIRRINHYSKEIQLLFMKLFTYVVLALEHDLHDFLGATFMELELSNHFAGQFFTPDHLSVMMAKINLSNAKMLLENKGHITISDPCCGAGSMPIATANVLKSMDIDFQSKAIFYVQDIDSVCVDMCFIQLSLIGAPAIVTLGDTLKMDIVSSWHTIGLSKHFQFLKGNFSGVDINMKLSELSKFYEFDEKFRDVPLFMKYTS